MIYVAGHQKPDLDSLVAAYGLAAFFEKTNREATPIRASQDVGSAAEWLFKKFHLPVPEYLDDVSDKEVFLVDHSETAQSPVGIGSAQVIGVLDHHLQGEGIDYPNIIIETVGSTATLITEKFLNEEVDLDPALAGLLLGAILDDTVIFRSPTTADRDRQAAEKLAQIANIDDVEQFGIDIFTAKSDWSNMTTHEMINTDAKEWDLNGNLVYCAAMETVDSEALMGRTREILETLREYKKQGGFHLVLALIVDILQQKSWIIVDPDDKDPVEDIFDDVVDEQGIMHVPGVLSRKKQVLKPLSEYYEKIN